MGAGDMELSAKEYSLADVREAEGSSAHTIPSSRPRPSGASTAGDIPTCRGPKPVTR